MMEKSIYNELAKIDLGNDSIETIESYLSQKILGHTRPTIDISPEALFRARIITKTAAEDLNTVKSIWYPDWTEIPQEKHQYGRLSDKGQNFFYGSNSLATTIRELKPNDGDVVLIGIFRLKNPQIKIKSQFAGIEAILRTNQFEIIRDFEYKTDYDRIIETFLSERFQEKITPKENYKYKLTIAFSNILLKNPEIGCIIYPSVASKLNSVNFGLKPCIIEDYFYCRSMYTYSVKKDSKAYFLIPQKFAKRIYANAEEAKNFEAMWKEVNEKDRRLLKRYGL